MAQDARFEDAPYTDRPLKLRAETAEDVSVISALVQDAVGKVGDVSWMPKRRRLAILLNRFRWEDQASASHARRPFERVRSLLVIDGVDAAKARGVDPSEKETIVSLLSLAFEPCDREEDCAGRLEITIAGDGALALDVECVDVTLQDLTQPWEAKASEAPRHEA